MTPEAALEAQIERYRQMTGEERLEIGLRLHEFACNVTREGIRAQHPKATPEEVEEHLKERIRLSYELSEEKECLRRLCLAWGAAESSINGTRQAEKDQ